MKSPRLDQIRLKAGTTIETEFGKFELLGFANEEDSREIMALKLGDVENEPAPLLVIHSECINGDVFHSLQCDCRSQLELAMQNIQNAGSGLLIYMKGHEGRGHGLIKKLHIYELMEQGLDAVDACAFLGIPIDMRIYQDAIDILRHFGVRRVRLMTNNPDKIKALANAGIEAINVPLRTTPTRQNKDYLLTKQTRLGHSLGLEPATKFDVKNQSDDSGKKLSQALQMYFSSNEITSLSLIPLNSLTNRVWLVKSTRGFFVLKQYCKLSYENIQGVHYLKSLLHRYPVAVPRVFTNIKGNTITRIKEHLFDLSEFIPHIPLRYPLMNISTSQIQEAARALASIHSIPLEELAPSMPAEPIGNPDHKIFTLLRQFEKQADALKKSATPNEKRKIGILKELIDRTVKQRNSIRERGKLSFQSQPAALNHGDYSLTNLLPSSEDRKLYVIDWDNAEIRPRVWELQRAMLLICGKGKCNAHIDELDFKRARVFLDEYEGVFPLKCSERNSLPEIAEYIFTHYWLHFTLASILRGDYRILRLVPGNVEQGLWWQNNIERYSEWLQAIQ